MAGVAAEICLGIVMWLHLIDIFPRYFFDKGLSAIVGFLLGSLNVFGESGRCYIREEHQ